MHEKILFREQRGRAMKADLCDLTQAALVYLRHAASQSGDSSQRFSHWNPGRAALRNSRSGSASQIVAASLCLSWNPSSTSGRVGGNKKLNIWDDTPSEILRLVPSGEQCGKLTGSESCCHRLCVGRCRETCAMLDSAAEVHVEGNQVTYQHVCSLWKSQRACVLLCFHGRVDVCGPLRPLCYLVPRRMCQGMGCLGNLAKLQPLLLLQQWDGVSQGVCRPAEVLVWADGDGFTPAHHHHKPKHTGMTVCQTCVTKFTTCFFFVLVFFFAFCLFFFF